MIMYELVVTVFPPSGLHEAAVPVLAALWHSTGEAVQLAVLDHLEVVFIDRLQSPQTLRFVSGVGHRIPAHASSTGKVLLAALDRGGAGVPCDPGVHVWLPGGGAERGGGDLAPAQPRR